MDVSVPELFFDYDEAGHLAGKYDGNGNPPQETAWLGDLLVAVLGPSRHPFCLPRDRTGFKPPGV
jgi:hypothetical protein